MKTKLVLPPPIECWGVAWEKPSGERGIWPCVFTSREEAGLHVNMSMQLTVGRTRLTVIPVQIRPLAKVLPYATSEHRLEDVE